MLPGSTDTEVPLPMLTGATAAGDIVALSSLRPFTPSGPPDSDAFWTFLPATGEVRPLPNLDGVEPATPAAFSPDGATALAVYGADGEETLATIDVVTGTAADLGAAGVSARPLAPFWSSNDTVLVYGTGETASLVTLAPADT